MFNTKFEREHVVFWKNLHSLKQIYMTAGRDGRDKFQVCPSSLSNLCFWQEGKKLLKSPLHQHFVGFKIPQTPALN